LVQTNKVHGRAPASGASAKPFRPCLACETRPPPRHDKCGWEIHPSEGLCCLKSTKSPPPRAEEPGMPSTLGRHAGGLESGSKTRPSEKVCRYIPTKSPTHGAPKPQPRFGLLAYQKWLQDPPCRGNLLSQDNKLAESRGQEPRQRSTLGRHAGGSKSGCKTRPSERLCHCGMTKSPTHGTPAGHLLVCTAHPKSAFWISTALSPMSPVSAGLASSSILTTLPGCSVFAGSWPLG